MNQQFRRRIWRNKVRLLRYTHYGRCFIQGNKRRRDEIQSALNEFARQEKPRILIDDFSIPIADISPEETFSLEAVEKDFAVRGIRPKREPADLLIVRSSGWRESSVLMGRSNRWAKLIAVWMRVNHFEEQKNMHLAAGSDVYFPAHGFAVDYLKNNYSRFGGVVPVCSDQWTTTEARQWYDKAENIDRCSALYGGFIEYADIGAKRNALIRACMKALDSHHLELRPPSPDDRYRSLSSYQAFMEWLSFKVSLALPVRNDVACRLFDALLVGHVPIVPADLYSLNEIISPELQESLPLVKFTEYSPKAVSAAYRLALEHFDNGGPAKARARHEYALGRHMGIHRVRAMVENLRKLAN